MTDETETLLNDIIHNAQMGSSCAHQLLEISEDAAIAAHLRREITLFEDLSRRAGAMLAAAGKQPPSPGRMTQLSAKAGIVMQTMRDRSARKAAEMLIEGNTIGATQMTESMRDARSADCGSLALAQRLRDAEREYAEELTAFL